MGIKVSQLLHFHNTASVMLGAPVPEIEMEDLSSSVQNGICIESVLYTYKSAQVKVTIESLNLPLPK